MARRRLRIRRFVYLLALLLVLTALLELNQWLPGGWPGGGGDGGFRKVQGPRPDVTRVRPALGLPVQWPASSVRVTLRAGGGDAVAGARLRLTDGSAAVTDAAGQAYLPTGQALARGFAVQTSDGALVEHGPALPGRSGSWEIRLPDRVTPGGAAPTASSPALALRVLSHTSRGEADGPVAGARVRWQGWSTQGEGRTDADGSVLLPLDEPRVRLVVEAPQHFLAARWVDARAGQAVVRLEPRASDVLTFVDALDATPVDVAHARLLDAQGDVLFGESALRARALARDRLDLSTLAGGDALADSILEVGGGDRPVVRLALAEATDPVRLPRGRSFPVRATDERGGRVAGLRVETRYLPPAIGTAAAELEEPAEVSWTGTDTAVLPEGVPGRVLVEAGFSAPRALEIGAEEAPQRRTVRLAPGGRLRVRIEDEHGAALPRAEVFAVAVVEGLRVVRQALTDDGGRAELADLPRGWLELYGHARGYAWQATTTEVGAGEEELPLRLLPGANLRLLVETPAGLPLEGVRVRVEPEGPPPLVTPPEARPSRTDGEGAALVLDLPDRTYRVRLSLPGYEEAVLQGVRPGDALLFATLVPRR